MKHLQAFLFPIFYCFASCYTTQHPATAPQAGPNLFLIIEHNRFGYIDQKGSVVVPPRFRNLGDFENGLAPARENGTYGYINLAGDFVLPPIYDYAVPFSEGLARVWINGQVSYIDAHGKVPFKLPDSIMGTGDFDHGIARISIRKKGKEEAFSLDRTGKITPWPKVEYEDGLAIVTRPSPKDTSDSWNEEYALQDESGKTLVPFGRFGKIGPFANGLAEVTIDLPNEPGESVFAGQRTGFINRLGKLAFVLPKGSIPFNTYFSEGLIGVTASRDTISNSWSPGADANYIVWYDTTGAIQFVKDKDSYPGIFYQGRCFTGHFEDRYLMDSKGRQLGPNRFKWIPETVDFSKGIALVAESNTVLWGAINKEGIYVIPPVFEKFASAGIQPEGILAAVIDKNLPDASKTPYTGQKYRWGLIDTKGNFIFKPKFTAVSETGFKNGLLYAETEERLGYINSSGDFVWSTEKIAPEKHVPEPVNVDYMARGWHYVYRADYESRYNPNEQFNRLQKIPSGTHFPVDSFGIAIQPDESAVIYNRYRAFKAQIFNTRKDSVNIDVQDNRLYLEMQAMDQAGNWQDIEYIPSSWCGNSYYKVTIYPGSYWDLQIPVYEGVVKTRLRLKFTWKKRHQETREEATMYSETFPGTINPAQFWRKEGHTASSIMDPYNE